MNNMQIMSSFEICCKLSNALVLVIYLNLFYLMLTYLNGYPNSSCLLSFLNHLLWFCLNFYLLVGYLEKKKI
jgi:hypothetical protein